MILSAGLVIVVLLGLCTWPLCDDQKVDQAIQGELCGLMDMQQVCLVYMMNAYYVYKSALQPGRIIQIIQVIWVTFCPDQSRFHPDMLLFLPGSELFSYLVH